MVTVCIPVPCGAVVKLSKRVEDPELTLAMVAIALKHLPPDYWGTYAAELRSRGWLAH